jgi:UrcA family protein
MSTVIPDRTARSRLKFALLTLTGSLVCALAAGTASAANADSDVPTLVVHYSTQALATETGVQDLYHRIVRAAQEVCPDESPRDLATHAKVRECREHAVAHAIQEINNSELAALYVASSKRG